ncbi:hypothetical protein AX16_004117 [Volvariella volvacea WC 439]|nr:hypothetical protein AX16_004117 [Volvariella volvacea WC 439]
MPSNYRLELDSSQPLSGVSLPRSSSTRSSSKATPQAASSSSPTKPLLPSPVLTPSHPHSHSHSPTTPTHTLVAHPESPATSEFEASSTSSTPSSSTVGSEYGDGEFDGERKGAEERPTSRDNMTEPHRTLQSNNNNDKDRQGLTPGGEHDEDNDADAHSDTDTESTLSDLESYTFDEETDSSERRFMFGYPLERMGRTELFGGPSGALGGVILEPFTHDHDQEPGSGSDGRGGQDVGERHRDERTRARASEKAKHGHINVARYLGSLSGKLAMGFGSAAGGRPSDISPPQSIASSSSASSSLPYSRFHTAPHSPPSGYTSPTHSHDLAPQARRDEGLGAGSALVGTDTPPVLAHIRNLIGSGVVPSSSTGLYGLKGQKYTYLPPGLTPPSGTQDFDHIGLISGEGPAVYVSSDSDGESEHEYVPGCPGCAQMKVLNMSGGRHQSRSGSESLSTPTSGGSGVGIWEEYGYGSSGYDVRVYESIVDDLLAENPAYLQNPPNEMILVDPSTPHSTDAFMIKCLPVAPSTSSSMSKSSPVFVMNSEFDLFHELNDSPTVRRDPWNPIPHLLCAVKRDYEYYVDVDNEQEGCDKADAGAKQQTKKKGTTVFLCMERLINFDEPPFVTVANYIDFFRQVLEGLTFLHEKHIALGTCADPYGYMVDLSSGAGRFAITDNGELHFVDGHSPYHPHIQPQPQPPQPEGAAESILGSASHPIYTSPETLLNPLPQSQTQPAIEPQDYYKALINTFDRTTLPVKYYFTDLSKAKKINTTTSTNAHGSGCGHSHSSSSTSGGSDHPLLRQDVKDCAVLFDKLVKRMVSGGSPASAQMTITSMGSHPSSSTPSPTTPSSATSPSSSSHPDPLTTQITPKLKSLISSMHSGTFGADNSRKLLEAMCKSLDGHLFGLRVDGANAGPMSKTNGGSTDNGPAVDRCRSEEHPIPSLTITVNRDNSPVRRATTPARLPSHSGSPTRSLSSSSATQLPSSSLLYPPSGGLQSHRYPYYSHTPGRYCHFHNSQQHQQQVYQDGKQLHRVKSSSEFRSARHHSSSTLCPLSPGGTSSSCDRSSSSRLNVGNGHGHAHAYGHGRMCRSGPGSGAGTPSGLRESVSLSDLLGMAAVQGEGGNNVVGVERVSKDLV